LIGSLVGLVRLELMPLLGLGDVTFIPCKYAAVAVITRSAPSAGKHGFTTVRSLGGQALASHRDANSLSVIFRAGTEISVVRKEQLCCK